jgi:galactokinase
VLVDLTLNGRTRKALVHSDRNGYVYVVDRTTGEVLSATSFAHITTSRGVTDAAVVERLPGPYRERTRHVVSENARVLAAVQGVGAAHFGALMNASHASLRDDYRVSVAALDELTAILREHPKVFGARLTRTGFGGAAIALGEKGRTQTVANDAPSLYDRAGWHGRALLPPPN